MPSENPTQLQRAREWVNRSLFNTPTAGAYFEHLVGGVVPSWSLLECKARVVEVIRETADTQTWVLKPSRRFRGFAAGQHVHVVVQKGGVRETRTFSLSSSPSRWRESGTVCITVKRVPKGRVTGWMHEQLEAGDVVVLSEAAGAFTLGIDPGACAYLAAGSGITPVMSHLRERVASNAPGSATLLYFANTRRDFIFGDELQRLRERARDISVHFVASHEPSPLPSTAGSGAHDLPQTVLAAAHVERLLAAAPRQVFVCGPPAFRHLAKQLLGEAGFDRARVVEESFGLPPVPVTEGEPVVVTFHSSDTTVRTEQAGTLLDLAEGAGLTPRSGCRAGICHTCKCTKRSGVVRNLLTGELSGPGKEDVQLCISVPVTDVGMDL
ncbi:MAG: iron-sulfur cluster-binding domain-containing protein [Sandaracinaceae bacterium]|jgi:ferredoxin-NADP reductase|nr:iron-sulfur cluster-binding domain-containing protein [Sandaracinaceae bacterium]MBK7153768.1 iron-sulfur cluster-binding domain-containing protein [Sandaracinaceae bacterium]MBK7775267.1 iron-sulfur cluster-binding domain-containing protein [Sandaracinaceae bacterium]MBK8408267.1 iron-sulfur cluster-binding domain-containing protein [Sandaracinaceae bacterium]MBP7682453.1 iron-sulfur cluster-binding domain-containing protein [Deltaproteobacteria bacterium]